jgi:hypothetical protein
MINNASSSNHHRVSQLIRGYISKDDVTVVLLFGYLFFPGAQVLTSLLGRLKRTLSTGKFSGLG